MNDVEKFGYIIALQYRNALGRVVQRVHREVFETQFHAQEQMGIMITENSKAQMWVVEIPILNWTPQLIVTKPAYDIVQRDD